MFYSFPSEYEVVTIINSNQSTLVHTNFSSCSLAHRQSIIYQDVSQHLFLFISDSNTEVCFFLGLLNSVILIQTHTQTYTTETLLIILSYSHSGSKSDMDSWQSLFNTTQSDMSEIFKTGFLRVPCSTRFTYILNHIVCAIFKE